jgi:hypothetical protein
VVYGFNVNTCVGITCADGFAFLIQNAALGTAALGGFGGNLGYALNGINAAVENSVAIEFDDYYNVELSDPSDNHIAAQSCGIAANTSNHASCNLSVNGAPPFQISDAANHFVEIAYVPGNLYTTVDGVLAMTTPVDLSTLLSLNNGRAYVGFTAGAGGSGQNADILTWSFSKRYSAAASLTSSMNPSPFGQPVTFTATISAKYPNLKAPTGQVTFMDGSTLLGTVDLTDGVAALQVPNLSVGTHAINSSYSGDTLYNPRTLKPFKQVVKQPGN